MEYYMSVKKKRDKEGMGRYKREEARSPFGGEREAANQCFSCTSMFLSFSFSLPSPFSENKTLKRYFCIAELLLMSISVLKIAHYGKDWKLYRPGNALTARYIFGLPKETVGES